MALPHTMLAADVAELVRLRNDSVTPRAVFLDAVVRFGNQLVEASRNYIQGGHSISAANDLRAYDLNALLMARGRFYKDQTKLGLWHDYRNLLHRHADELVTVSEKYFWIGIAAVVWKPEG